jgi:hypothetical protein
MPSPLPAGKIHIDRFELGIPETAFLQRLHNVHLPGHARLCNFNAADGYDLMLLPVVREVL